MYSFPDLEPVCCSMFSSNCCFLTYIQISQKAGHVVWYSHLVKNFPKFVVIHTASLVAQMVKRLPKMRETWFQFLGREVPLEKEMETHSSILAWKIPWTEEPGRLQSMLSQRVGHDWVTELNWTKLGNHWFNFYHYRLYLSFMNFT